MSSRIQLKYLFEDKPYDPAVEPSDYDALDFVSAGCHLYGKILWPDGSFAADRPCVILLHGFPGAARSDDLAYALCRIGCVVVVPHHRGAWGSEGKYLVSNCIQDALALADWARSPAFCRQYRVDARAVFLAGHSMGGNTALNAGRTLPWLRGLILMTPFDPTRALRDGHPETLHRLLPEGDILRSDGLDAIFDDIAAHVDSWQFERAFAQVRTQNLCCVTGRLDEIAPGEQMVQPLWQKLRAAQTPAIHRLLELPAGHGLCGSRIALIRFAAQFIADALAEE